VVQTTEALTGDRELWFPEGIPGFADARRFLLTDLTEDRVRDHALPQGSVDVKVCAIDVTWSALKLVRRR
jgi:flagellar assembly factor FliW